MLGPVVLDSLFQSLRTARDLLPVHQDLPGVLACLQVGPCRPVLAVRVLDHGLALESQHGGIGRVVGLAAGDGEFEDLVHQLRLARPVVLASVVVHSLGECLRAGDDRCAVHQD